MELNIAIVDDIEHGRTVIQNCLDLFQISNDKDGHGIGLRSVQNIVNRYNGSMAIETHNGIFNVSIIRSRANGKAKEKQTIHDVSETAARRSETTVSGVP